MVYGLQLPAAAPITVGPSVSPSGSRRVRPGSMAITSRSLWHVLNELNKDTARLNSQMAQLNHTAWLILYAVYALLAAVVVVALLRLLSGWRRGQLRSVDVEDGSKSTTNAAPANSQQQQSNSTPAIGRSLTATSNHSVSTFRKREPPPSATHPSGIEGILMDLQPLGSNVEPTRAKQKSGAHNWQVRQKRLMSRPPESHSFRVPFGLLPIRMQRKKTLKAEMSAGAASSVAETGNDDAGGGGQDSGSDSQPQPTTSLLPRTHSIRGGSGGDVPMSLKKTLSETDPCASNSVYFEPKYPKY